MTCTSRQYQGGQDAALIIGLSGGFGFANVRPHAPIVANRVDVSLTLAVNLQKHTSALIIGGYVVNCVFSD